MQAIARRRLLRALRQRPPQRALTPAHLYPKGPNGGYMVRLDVNDERTPRVTPRSVCLEMRPPDETCDRWYACKPELSTIECAAALGTAITTLFRVSRFFHSRRECGRRVFFITQELYEYDVVHLDEFVRRARETKGIRCGRHAESCPDRQHHGRCSPSDRRRTHRRPRPSRGWSAGGRTRERPRTDRAATPTLSTMHRQTLTESAIHASTSDATARQRLLEEQRSVIEAERDAGLFVPEGEEVL